MTSVGTGHGGWDRLSGSTGCGAAEGWSGAVVGAGALHALAAATTRRLRTAAATGRRRRAGMVEMMASSFNVGESDAADGLAQGTASTEAACLGPQEGGCGAVRVADDRVAG
ncbi:hypothetical protein GCM10022197_22340 [Microlunatus spumicola]|uniref:Uncharacterized protein n=1 Tax=Microlunatus spumicola TaxID=81499 RepID=A0ABP6XEN2_9ACTN